jgi:hypothetical protein
VVACEIDSKPMWGLKLGFQPEKDIHHPIERRVSVVD